MHQLFTLFLLLTASAALPAPDHPTGLTVFDPPSLTPPHNGEFIGYASTYAECASLTHRASDDKNTGFCDKLPLYDAETKRSFHGECMTRFGEVIDACVRNFDEKKGLFEFKVSFEVCK
ncbi:hypothetical protein BC829DRAFT_443498 [Chytridium lagenaria]|nr:hypothetical protein BC829DRAFT_443498 [Chytridium lagenaria]